MVTLTLVLIKIDLRQADNSKISGSERLLSLSALLFRGQRASKLQTVYMSDSQGGRQGASIIKFQEKIATCIIPSDLWVTVPLFGCNFKEFLLRTLYSQGRVILHYC